MRISGITYIPRKTHKARNITVTVIILVILFFLTVLAVSAFSGWKLTHPAKATIAAFSSNIAPDFTDVTFYDIKKELKLKGWYFQAKGSAKTVILAHGYAKNRLQFGETTLELVKPLLNKGYNVLLFDFRNSGLSEGDFTTISVNEKNDLLGAVKYIKSQGSKKIALMGFSMGAATSILSAAESNDADAVIADSSFADLKEYIDTSLPVWTKLPSFPFNKTIPLSVKVMTGFDPSKSSPREAIKKISPKPVLLIHSKDDQSISVKNSRELYNTYFSVAGSKAEYWETEGVGHVGTFEKNPSEYMKRVIDFLEKSLTDKSSAK